MLMADHLTWSIPGDSCSYQFFTLSVSIRVGFQFPLELMDCWGGPSRSRSSSASAGNICWDVWFPSSLTLLIDSRWHLLIPMDPLWSILPGFLLQSPWFGIPGFSGLLLRHSLSLLYRKKKLKKKIFNFKFHVSLSQNGKFTCLLPNLLSRYKYYVFKFFKALSFDSQMLGFLDCNSNSLKPLS